MKNKSSVYLLLRTKEGKLRVFVSKNKDIAHPFNLFDVLSGNEEAVNLDLLGANVRSDTADLGPLRADVEANLRTIDSLINENNRKWPFARDTEIKLP